MAYIDARVLDFGLNVLDTEATHIHICSSEPSTFAAATGALSLGNKASLNIGAPAARSPNGRKVTVAAITSGNVTGTGTAGNYAIVDTANNRLLAAGSLSASQAVTSGNTFTLPACAGPGTRVIPSRKSCARRCARSRTSIRAGS